MRKGISLLCGGGTDIETWTSWETAVKINDTYKTKGWKTMAVPKVWEAELANEDGIVWFRKTIDLPAGVTGKKPE